MFSLAKKKSFSIGAALLAVMALSAACSDSSFKAVSFKAGSKQNPARSGDVLPLPVPGSVPSNSPNPIIDITEGGIRNRNIKSIYFSGNGPGSCGGAVNCVPEAPACIAPAVKLESAAMQGDCFACASFPGKCPNWSRDHRCNGNRAVCTDVSQTAKDVTLQLHLTFDAACPTPGFVPAGPVGGNYHVLGLARLSADNSNTTFSTVRLCKRTKPAAQVKSGDYLVTDIRFMTPGQRLKTPPPEAQRCPASDPAGAFKWAAVGVIPDCGVGQGVTPPAEYGICSGFLAVCQKTERIP